jgi:hypothetical protein
MKKIFFYLFFCLFFSSKVFACNFHFQDFGSRSENLKINLLALKNSDPLGGLTITVPIESFCNVKQLAGTMVTLFYIDNELVQIKLERFNQQDRNLMDLGIRHYGNFKRSLGFDYNNWRGTHTWQTISEIANYKASVNKNIAREDLQITSKRYLRKISEYHAKKEKWKRF